MEVNSNRPSMTAPPSKTMFNYFTKLPSKAIIVEESNPRKLAPVFNKQHVEEFQNTRLERFDAELFNLNNNHHQDEAKNTDGVAENGSNTNGNSHSTPEEVPMDTTKDITTYLTSLISGQYRPFKLNRKLRGPLRAKLLQYHEDVRPPYWGTWQKNSRRITGRRPLAMDEDVFDYEVDSEAEWDIGGPGESLKGDDSDDDEELDDYEIDMKTFVPHGYVSDDEVEVHSDQEETPSANQSMEEVCDEIEDSNNSVRIICEKRIKRLKVDETNTDVHQRQSNQNGASAQTVPQQIVKQVKQDIKPITLGLYYESEEQMTLSESKIQFLKTFQGISCK